MEGYLVTWDTQPRGIDGLSRLSGADNAFVTATGSTIPRTLANRFGEFINIKDFGASSDATPSYNSGAIQDAFDAAIEAVTATVLIPAEAYQYDTGLTLAPDSSQIHVNILGIGGVGGSGTRLIYTGTNGQALTIQNNTRFGVSNLALINNGSGTNEGLVVRSLAAGSNTGPGLWQNIRIAGFDIDAHFGNSADFAVSEQLFINFEVQTATSIGFFMEDSTGAYNTTNFNFMGFYGASNGTGFKWTGPPGANGPPVKFYGGSSSNNGLDFDFETPAQVYIGGMHIDSGGYFIRFGPSDPSTGGLAQASLFVEGLQTSYTSASNGIFCKLHHAGRYTFRNCIFNNTGYFSLDGATGAQGTLIVHATTIDDSNPIRYTGNRSVWSVDLFDVGTDTGTPGLQIDDRRYIIRNDGTEYDVGPRLVRSAGLAGWAAGGKYTAADATPSVIGWVGPVTITNGGTVTITNFDDGYERQEISMLFTDGNTTVQDSVNVQLTGGSNFTGTANDILTLVKVGSVWYEKARSAN